MALVFWKNAELFFSYPSGFAESASSKTTLGINDACRSGVANSRKINGPTAYLAIVTTPRSAC